MLRRRRNKPQRAKETIWTFIFYFSIFQTFFHYWMTQMQVHDIKLSIWITFNIFHAYTSCTGWEHNVSNWEHLWYEKQTDPSSKRDETLQNHHTSCEILQQSLCYWWSYSTCQASHATSSWFSWHLVRLCQMLTNHEAYQIYSSPVGKYSYDVESDSFPLLLSPIFYTIYHIWVPTQNVLLWLQDNSPAKYPSFITVYFI